MSTHICLWSGPRNISTSLMYSFAQRSDTEVVDEPLYGYYLAQHPSAREYHPMAREILDTMDQDGQALMERQLARTERPTYFYKQMIHHLLDMDLSFLHQTKNIILTRDPREMLPSYAQVIDQPNIDDVGYRLHIALRDFLRTHAIPYVVLEAKQVLLDPDKVLRELCGDLGIAWEADMLTWEAGPIPEDGIWAPHWYANVHRSTGFLPYRAKETAFPPHLEELYAQCKPYYEELIQEAIMA